MLYKSALMAQASGSVGGLTASTNRGGAYFRRRSTPVNPRTPEQIAVRTGLSNIAGVWSQVLTQAQRDAWTLFGKNVPKVNVLGEARQQSGIAAFVAANTPRLQTGLPVVLDGPTTFVLPSTPVVTLAFTGTGASKALSISIANEGDYPTDGNFLFYEGRPQSLGVSYFIGPYRFAAQETIGTPGWAPQVSTLPYPISANQRIYGYVRATLADGRLSPAGRVMIDVPSDYTAAAAPAAAAAAAPAAAKKKVRRLP